MLLPTEEDRWPPWLLVLNSAQAVESDKSDSVRLRSIAYTWEEAWPPLGVYTTGALPSDRYQCPCDDLESKCMLASSKKIFARYEFSVAA